jgi:hypothetical protein
MALRSSIVTGRVLAPYQSQRSNSRERESCTGYYAGPFSKGSGQSQHARLSNTTQQASKAAVYNAQVNIYAPVFIGSYSVGQANTATNSAAAFNLNETFQALFQSAGIHIFRF